MTATGPGGAQGPRVVLDACVLYPTVLRELLFGAARAGLFRPLWSERILEEWARATVKLGPRAEAIARGEIAAARAAFPRALVPADPARAARLWLPDPGDVHVLATALSGRADAILTFNAADFPRGLLAGEGLLRFDPDGFLTALAERAPGPMREVAAAIAAEATRLAGEPWDARRLLRRGRLHRLARTLG